MAMVNHGVKEAKMIFPRIALRISVAVGICLSILCLPSLLSGQNYMVAPMEEVKRRSSEFDTPSGEISELPFRFLRDVISRVDGARCPMYPTDTQFGIEAARRHGPLLGILFLIDRLFHEWSEMKRTDVVTIYGRSRFYDPLDANDFWLRDKNSMGAKR